MNKLILSFLLFGAVVLPVCAQTYEELNDLALAAVQKDSLVKGETYILQALKLQPANPHNGLLFSNLGIIQSRLGKNEEAIESYTYGLNISPRNVALLLNRASLYMEVGKEDLARVDYSLILDLDTENEEALLMRAYIYRKKRDYKAAKSDYERLLEFNPKHYSGQLGLATLEQKEGKLDEALALLTKMIANMSVETSEKVTNSALSVIYVARANVENEMRQTDLALVDLEEAIRLNSSQADAYLLRGKIYLLQKKKGLAKRDFEKAVSLGVSQMEARELLKQCN